MAKKTAKEKTTTRRGNGEGSIYQRSDGLWVALISYTDPVTNAKERKPLYGKTRPEVLAKKKEWQAEVDKNGGVVPVGKMTVENWLTDWLEIYKKSSVRENTYQGEKRIVEKHLIPVIGSYKLKDLRSEHIQKMLNNKLKTGSLKGNKPLSPRMVEHIYIVLHDALKQAVKNQIIARNPCVAVNKPKKNKTEFIPWTTEQTNAFLKSVKDNRLFPLYMVAWGAGLRRSEILGLKWSDIDFKRGTLTVNRSLVKVVGSPPYKFEDPKTKKSRRMIPLPAPVIKELATWKKRQASEKLAFNGSYNPLNLVFCDEAGQPYNPDLISRSFKSDREAAQLPEIRFHDLRHGHATQLLEMGEDIKVISDRLGHSTISITADTYAHVAEKMQRSASNKLGKTLEI